MLFIIVVSTLVDILLRAIGVYPPWDRPIDDRLALVATAYRIVISIAGAWITAWLAPSQPMRYAMILGYVGVVLGLIGVIVSWNAALGPRWYPIALAALAIPQCWAGGKECERTASRRIAGAR